MTKFIRISANFGDGNYQFDISGNYDQLRDAIMLIASGVQLKQTVRIDIYIADPADIVLDLPFASYSGSNCYRLGNIICDMAISAQYYLDRGGY